MWPSGKKFGDPYTLDFFPAPVTCDTNYYFACEDGQQCVSNSYRCDGAPDCRDGSDERNCGVFSAHFL